MLKMQQPTISVSDKLDLDKLARCLCLKSAQVIVQGRLGKSISSECSLTSTGSRTFNLAIKDYPEIQKEAKSALKNGSLSFQSSFVVEISLQTCDSESLILEVWSLSLSRKFDDERIPHGVYRKMAMMLKSLMCVSRATPAYKLSRNQGREYVNCFRIYTGKEDISGLEGISKTVRIGSIGTPGGTFTLSVAFRTSENLYVSTKKLVSPQAVKLSHDHFSSPGKFGISSARPCNTLQSRLMGSKEFLSTSRSSSEPFESPTYRVLPSSVSPNDIYTESSKTRAAMFTIGTPPATHSLGRTSPQAVVDYRRKLSDISFDREPKQNLIDKNQKPFLLSHSEQKFSFPHHRDPSQRRIAHIGSVQDQRNVREQHSSDDILNDASMHSTLTNGDNSFRPISYSPSSGLHHSRSSSIDNVQSLPTSPAKSGKFRKSNVDYVTALKSSSPTKAKVGFPDNIDLTSPLAQNLSMNEKQTNLIKNSTNEETSVSKSKSIPITGAFIDNSRIVKKAYAKLNEDPEKQKFPFDDLISCPEKVETGSRINDSGPAGSLNSSETRLSSQSSQSSLDSDDAAPSRDDDHNRRVRSDDFFLVELNPAFGRMDSAKDLCAFYREIENAPNLVMFKENNGEETQETLLDLTKQLEDYRKDAADFDDFVQELRHFECEITV